MLSICSEMSILGTYWFSISEDSPQGVWDTVAERMLLEFAESDCPIFRAVSTLSRGRLKSKGHGKLTIHYAANFEKIETILRISNPANQFSLHGAIAEMCEEYVKTTPQMTHFLDVSVQ